MARTFDKWVILGLALVGTVVVINAGVAYRNTWQVHDDSNWVAHTHEVLDAFDDLLSTMKDTETGQRGFLITGDERYLKPYEDALGAVDGKVAKVKQLTEDNPRQQARISRLQELLRAKLDELQSTIALRKGQGFAAAQKEVVTDLGKNRMDAIRASIAEMQADEQRLLWDRQTANERGYLTSLVTAAVAALIGLAGVVGFIALLRRHLQARVKAATVLYEQREWFRTTLSSIGDAVIATDPKGRVTFLNDVAEALTGYTEVEAKGQPLETIFRIVNEDTRQAVENPAVRAMRQGTIVGLSNHTVLLCKTGVEYLIDDSAAPIRDEKGQVAGVVLVFRDVTDQKRREREFTRRLEQQVQSRTAELRASEERFRLLVDGTRDHAIFMLDPTGRIDSWNPGAERIKQYRANEIIGQNFSRFFPSADIEAGKPERELAVAAAEGIYEEEGRRVRKDGTQFWARVVLTALRDDAGNLRGFSKVTRDITEKKLAEENAGRLLQEEAARRAAEEYAQVIEGQREQLRVTLASIGDGVITTDTEGRVTLLNRVAEALTGWTNEDAAGQPLLTVFRIIDEMTRQRVEDPVAKVLISGRINALANHTALIAKDGTERSIADSAAPIRNRMGRITGVVLVFRDVSARRRQEQEQQKQIEQLAEAEERIRSVVNTVIDGIITIDERGVVQTFNPAAEKLFAYASAEVVGQNIKMLMPEPFHAEHDGYLANYLRTGQAKIIGIGREVEGRRKDGGTFPMELAVSEFRLGEQRYFTGIVRDISERKRSEEALKQADRNKDEFLAMLAHELLNPLAPVQNALHLLQQPGGTGEMVEQAGGILQRQVLQMVRLVDDLLDVTRISRGNLALRNERVELAPMVNNAVETCRPLIEQMGHGLTVTLPPQPLLLDADPVRLTQVFSNLLNNAAKYTEPGGSIWLTVERQGSDAVVTVKDTGQGIPADKLPHIFEMFTQVDQPRRRSQGGLGLGLTLVKRLTEMHGGSVEAKSDGVGQGAEFTVRLPVAIGPVPPPLRALGDLPQLGSLSNEKTTDLPRRRILVVDDSRDGADCLAMMLRVQGHEVETAYDGMAAVEAAEHFQPDVVLLDIGLPKLNGYETARRIRQEPWGQGMVLIAVTGWGQEEDKHRSQEAGFNEHLVKPVNSSDLEKLLVRLVPVTM